MHNPRGSNNRYRGDTNNQNRAFNSQNNANGGYGWGPQMEYYEGSLLQIEWTAQHGCGAGHPNTDCEIVLQYMCGPWIRDGLNDQTPPDNSDDNLEFVQHEPPNFWRDCDKRSRNRGLFIADQNIGNDATETRQNDGGRRGWECNEERDYYPYWHPTPWKDIAILTSGSLTTRCPYYYANSQNKVAKGHCLSEAPAAYDWNNPSTIPLVWGKGTQVNLQKDCVSTNELPQQQWVVVNGWGLPDPECISHPLTRDNHLGNADFGAATARYLWTIPSPVWDNPAAPDDAKLATCVFRMRYNISSGDYNGWAEVDDPNAEMIDAKYNGKESPVRGNPKVNFGFDANNNMRNLTLALNTDQYGRTFEDRSHSFFIRPRVGISAAARIFNLNVRGRRGNIVQAYPAVEYDFVPTNLRVARGDYIHFQWTGSDTNNANQAGEGTDRTDRSNIVQLKNNDRRTNLLNSFEKVDTDSLVEPEVAFKLAHINQHETVCTTYTETGCCLTYAQLEEKHGQGNNGAINTDIQNCAKLNAAPARFDGGLVQMGKTGTMNYMSSRNNNFTNRSQKASITVTDKLPPAALSVVIVGVAAFAGGAIIAFGVIAAKFSPACANIFSGVKV